MVMASLLRLLGVPVVLGPLAVALKLHLLGMQLLPRVSASGALLIAALWFQHWSLLLGCILMGAYWMYLKKNIWWLVEMGWRKETAELVAKCRKWYYNQTGNLRHARLACPLPKLEETKAGHVAVVRTSRGGERLQPLAQLELVKGQPNKGEVSLVIDPSMTFQEFMGFGTSFTESSCKILQQMGSASQERIVDAYFHPETGLGFNMGRLHMNSCDFSDGNWTCCENEDLSKFCVDRYEEAILPMVRRASKVAAAPLTIFASPWSPPKWMKDSGEMCQGGKLKEACRPVWAKFYVRFAQMMKEKGLSLWGFSVQNEPDGQTPWENCLYSPEEERDFIRDHLGPELEKSGLDLKLIAWDHNRDDLFLRAHTIYSDQDAAKYVWGMGWHWYGDARYEWWADAAGQSCFDNVRKTHELRPEKHLIVTETCQECGAHLGDWSLAERYAESIIRDFNNWCEAWIDWNFLLTKDGGPNHVGNVCSAPLLADLEKEELSTELAQRGSSTEVGFVGSTPLQDGAQWSPVPSNPSPAGATTSMAGADGAGPPIGAIEEPDSNFDGLIIPLAIAIVCACTGLLVGGAIYAIYSARPPNSPQGKLSKVANSNQALTSAESNPTLFVPRTPSGRALLPDLRETAKAELHSVESMEEPHRKFRHSPAASSTRSGGREAHVVNVR